MTKNNNYEQPPPTSILSSEQINSYIQDGILVVENVLTKNEIDDTLNGLHNTLYEKYGINTYDLDNTGHLLTTNLSSTNGSGGVLDIFYEKFQLNIATNERLFQITTELWNAAYCHNNETKDDLSDELMYKWHPYGSFDVHKGYMYLDRIGYRLPTKLANELGQKYAKIIQEEECNNNNNNNNEQIDNNNKQNNNKSNNNKTTIKNNSNKKVRPIQRSLTPHLDCCPEKYFDNNNTKWRPIQCFVSLTDTLQPQHGGLEVCRKFHHNFHKWKRSDTILRRKNGIIEHFPPPCIGNYTHIRPKEDKDIYDRIEHIPIPAGAAVFWDNRLPHANSYTHIGTEPRIVIYCSFLPDVPINRIYCQKQLNVWKNGQTPNDQWINNNIVNQNNNNDNMIVDVESQLPKTKLARRLAGIDPWCEE